MHLGQDFTPDLLSIILVVATQAKEELFRFTKEMFESRLFFVDKLIDTGATNYSV